MASKYIDIFPIPKTFPEVLHDFAKEVIRVGPKDIYDFGVKYFKALESRTAFVYQKEDETAKEERQVVIVDNMRELDKYDRGRFNRSMEKVEKIKQFEEKHFGEKDADGNDTSRNVSGFVGDVIQKTVSRLGTEINNEKKNEEMQQEMKDGEGDENDTSRNVSGFVGDVIQKTMSRLGTEINEKKDEEQRQQGEHQGEEGQYQEENDEQYREGQGQQEQEGEVEQQQLQQEGEEQEQNKEEKQRQEEEGEEEQQDEEDERQPKEGEEEQQGKEEQFGDRLQGVTKSLEEAENFVDDVIQKFIGNLEIDENQYKNEENAQKDENEL